MAQTSGDSALATAAERAASGANRLLRAWRALSPDRRLAAYAAAGLFFAQFLPWYQETVIVSGATTRLQSASASITGWGAFSFVQAALLLIAAGVLLLLFQRAEGRAFHLPGGDGWTITAAGLLGCLLIVWAIFEKQGTSVRGPGATASGIEWGIIAALAIAATLTWAGSRMRATPTRELSRPRESRPPRAGEPDPQPRTGRDPRPSAASAPVPASRDEQLTIPLEPGATEQ